MSRIVQDLRRRCGTESDLGQRYLLNTGDNNISAQHREGWSRNWLFSNTIPVLGKNKHKKQTNNKNPNNQQTKTKQTKTNKQGADRMRRVYLE